MDYKIGPIIWQMSLKKPKFRALGTLDVVEQHWTVEEFYRIWKDKAQTDSKESNQ